MAFPYLTDALNHYFGTGIHLPLPTFGAFVALAILIAMQAATNEVIRLQENGAFDHSPTSGRSFIPKEIVSGLAFVGVLVGLLGAKLFDSIERLDELLADPIAVLFSTGGFSIYGGLILGGVAGILYVKRKAISIIPMLDACAPALALGYSIGRLGCQFSGDGDWGIESALELKPSWLPDWFWAQTYENNALGTVIPSPGVYPTPVYEAIASMAIFLLLWWLRKRLKTPGELFSIYLICSGIERILIEKIRINIEYSFLGIEMTQAQLISIVLVIAGLVGLLKISQFNYVSKLLFSVIILGTLTACSTW